MNIIFQSHIFKDVLSMDTWKTVLTEEQKTHLKVHIFHYITVVHIFQQISDSADKNKN